MGFRSDCPDVDAPDVSVCEFLFGPSVAPTSHRELIHQIDGFAGALPEMGIGVGDVVARYEPDSPTFAVVFHDTLRSRATATTVSGLSTSEKIATRLRDAGARLLCTVGIFAAKADEAAVLVGLGPGLARPWPAGRAGGQGRRTGPADRAGGQVGAVVAQEVGAVSVREVLGEEP